MTLSPAPPSDRWLLATSALLLLGLLVAAVVREARPSWANAQASAYDLVLARSGAEAARELPRGIQQIWIPELDRVDRCVTCHLTIEAGEAFADAPHPFRAHPRPDLLAAHPVDRFGCTLCHGGQGAATTKEAAHGDVPHWEWPLLSARRARPYGLEARDLLELRCNVCHRHEREVAGMDLLNAAKAEVEKRRCVRCHTIEGHGAARGPDLTWIGDKHPSRFPLPASLLSPRSALRWHIQHFLDPKAMSPGTEMPTFTLTERQAAGLALLVMSWRKEDIPPAWMPHVDGPAGPDGPSGTAPGR